MSQISIFIESVDDKLCKSLDIVIDDKDYQEAFGGVYKFLATIKVNEGDQGPLYRRKSSKKDSNARIFHDGNKFLGTVSDVNLPRMNGFS